MVSVRKPFSFNTTLRNPSRMISFLQVISNYEGKILDYDTVIEIEADFIRNKIFEPTRSSLGTYVSSFKNSFYAKDQSENAEEKVRNIFSKWKNNDPKFCSLKEITYLLNNTLTKHGEKGYEYGWPSRFYTQISMLNEFGFSYLVRGQKILISDNGRLLLGKYRIQGNSLEKITDDNDKSELFTDINSDESYSAYLIALSKYQTNNPWRNNTIKVNFLKLVLQTLNYLDDRYGFKGINRSAISFIICWDNQDYKKLGDIIYKFHKKFSDRGFSQKDTLYKYVMNLFMDDEDNFKPATEEFIQKKGNHFKPSKLLSETPDEVIRKLRLSQLISLRGNGNRIDINRTEIGKVNYIIEKIHNNNFETPLDYFHYMGQINRELLFTSFDSEDNNNIKDIKQRKLIELSIDMSWDSIREEIDIASGSKKISKNKIFSDLPGYVSMEFLSAIMIKKALPKAEVIPFYKVDDEGIAIQCASGKNSNNSGEDIDVYMNGTRMMLEPTVGLSRSFQVEHEIPSIYSHYLEASRQDNDDVFSVFLAKRIFPIEVEDLAGYYNEKRGTEIYIWDTGHFINQSKKSDNLSDYRKDCYAK